MPTPADTRPRVLTSESQSVDSVHGRRVAQSARLREPVRGVQPREVPDPGPAGDSHPHSSSRHMEQRLPAGCAMSGRGEANGFAAPPGRSRLPRGAADSQLGSAPSERRPGGQQERQPRVGKSERERGRQEPARDVGAQGPLSVGPRPLRGERRALPGRPPVLQGVQPVQSPQPPTAQARTARRGARAADFVVTSRWRDRIAAADRRVDAVAWEYARLVNLKVTPTVALRLAREPAARFAGRRQRRRAA